MIGGGIIASCLIWLVMPDAPSASELREKEQAAKEDAITSEKIDVWVTAQGFIKRKLKSPGTADFGGLLSDYQDPKRAVTINSDGTYDVRGWVDAQNGFGGVVRSRFTVKMKKAPNGDYLILDWNLSQR